VVRYRDTCCAAFENFELVNLKEGDEVFAELDKVGLMVMRHVGLHKDFEVFAHSGEIGLIACLLLIEQLNNDQKAPHTHSKTEELAYKKFFSDSLRGQLEGPTTNPALWELP
jgi:hypothetical protein